MQHTHFRSLLSPMSPRKGAPAILMMAPIILMMATAIMTLAASAHAQGGSAYSQRPASVTVYAGGDFRGTSETFYDDVPNMKRTRVGNDQASSIRIAPGCTVTLFAGGDFRGQSASLDRDVRNLSRTAVGNDAVSSLRLRCSRSQGGDHDWSGRRGVSLYRDGAFTGRREIFYEGDPDLRNNRIGCTASSVRVAPGCRATLFSEPDYRGRSIEVDYDVRDLGATRLGNDVAASLRVYCGDRRSDRRNDRRRDRHGDRRDDRYDDHRDDRWGDDYDDRRSGNSGGATLFAGGDYSGRSETFYGDIDDLSRTAVGNDTVSSLQVAPGCRLVLFEHQNYRGNSSTLTDDVSDMRRTSLGNDRASSLRLDCDRRGYGGRRDRRGRDRGGVTLYRGGDFSGGSETFYRDVRDLSRTSVGNDAASSVRVSPGCRVILYAGGDFRGVSTVLTHDAENLRLTRVGNDTVSSIEVDCR